MTVTRPKLETLPHRFLGLTEEDSRLESARAVIVPVPYEATVSYGSGAGSGPAAIIRASRQVEFYDVEEDADVHLAGIATLDEVEPLASGPADMVDGLTDLAGEIFDRGRIPVCLGGEHSVSLGFIRAAAERFSNLTVLQLDAHADLRDEFHGTPYSHACVMRRALDVAPVVAAGIRSFSVEERDLIRARGLDPLLARDMAGRMDWLRPLVDRLSENVYLTIDVDAFDPGIMPATGTPEPGGLDWRQVLAIARAAAKERRLVGFDVVELAPLPGQNGPDFTAARLVYKILTYLLADSPGRAADLR